MRLSNISNEYKAIKKVSQQLFLESFECVLNFFFWLFNDVVGSIITLDNLQRTSFDNATKRVAHPDLGYRNAGILRKEIKQMLDLHIFKRVAAMRATAPTLDSCGFSGGGGNNVVVHNGDN